MLITVYLGEHTQLVAYIFQLEKLANTYHKKAYQLIISLLCKLKTFPHICILSHINSTVIFHAVTHKSIALKLAIAVFTLTKHCIAVK